MQISKAGKLNNNPGFTLIELIIVLFILTLVLGVVTPRVVSGLYGNTQKSVLRKLSNAVTYARNQAILQGQPWLLRLDLTDSRIRLLPQNEQDTKGQTFDSKKWKSLSPLKIRDIQDETGNIKDSKKHDIYFSPKGLVLPTIIHLVNARNEPVQTVQLKPFNRQIKFYTGYISYEEIFVERQ